MMKKKLLCALPLVHICVGLCLLGYPLKVEGTKVNLPTVKEALTVLNMQRSLKPAAFTLMSSTHPTEPVTFSVQVCPQSSSKKLKDLSLAHPLLASCQARFKWKSWVDPRNCFVQGDLMLNDPHKGKLLVRVIGRFHFPPWNVPTCELYPTETPPTLWEFD